MANRSNQLADPNAREAMSRFEMEAAFEDGLEMEKLVKAQYISHVLLCVLFICCLQYIQ